MADLTDLNGVSGSDLTEAQIAGILAQIDLDIHNLLRGGKLSALKYAEGGAAGRSADRAENLRALIEARRFYTGLQQSLPGWHVNEYDDPDVDD